MPVTTPDASIKATPVLLLAHAPPAVASLTTVTLLWHTDSVPLIADGNGLTVVVTVR